MYLAGTIMVFIGLMTMVGTLLSYIPLMLADPRIRMEGRYGLRRGGDFRTRVLAPIELKRKGPWESLS